MFLSTASLMVTSRIRLSPITVWPGTGELMVITGPVVSETQSGLVAVLTVLLVKSVSDRVTTAGFCGSVVIGALKLNTGAVPTAPVVLDQLKASDLPPFASMASLASTESSAPPGPVASAQPRVFGFSRVMKGAGGAGGVRGISELKRIFPNNAGAAPLQCCSKLTARLMTPPKPS